MARARSKKVRVGSRPLPVRTAEEKVSALKLAVQPQRNLASTEPRRCRKDVEAKVGGR